MSEPFVPESIFPVEATAGVVTTNGGVTCDNISLKNVEWVWILVHMKQAVGHATALTPKKGTVVATAATVLGVDVPIWYGNISTSSNALTRQTDAANFSIGVGVTGDVIVVFSIDPKQLGDFDSLGFTLSDSSQATNLVSVVYLIKAAYAQRAASNVDYLTD